MGEEEKGALPCKVVLIDKKREKIRY